MRGDGVADDTAAIQAALDVAGKSGGEVASPTGKRLLRGTLSIPTGVILAGSWQPPHHGAWQSGSTLLVTDGRGDARQVARDAGGGGARWKPSILVAPNGDARDLGAYLLGVEMISEVGAAIEDLNWGASAYATLRREVEDYERSAQN